MVTGVTEKGVFASSVHRWKASWYAAMRVSTGATGYVELLSTDPQRGFIDFGRI